MGISPRQIGWSNESNLLWQISKQMDNLTNVTSTSLSTIIADLATKVTNQQGVPSFRADTLANLPVAGQTGRMFVATDTYAFYRDNGLGWDLIGGPGIGTVTGSGTATQVAFWNGTSVISGSNNLFWDNANSRLGIGTSSPTALLDVRGTGVSTDFRLSRNIDPNIYLSINAPGNTPNRSTFGINGTNVMTLNASGNVGIGTTTPGDRLEVSGNVYATAFHAVGSIARFVSGGGTFIAGLTGSSYGSIQSYSDASGTGRALSINPSGGNVGIATTTPQTQLDIANGLMFGTIDAFPSATYDAAAVIAKTGSLGSAPFNNAGSIVYRARVTSTAGRSSHIFYTGSPSTERMRLDESGNLGLGVTPSAWSNFRVIQGVGTSGNSAIAFNNSGGLDLVYNTFYNGTNFIYLTTGNLANRYTVEAGTYKWYTAPSGTAGNAISFTQAMTLDASGRLGIGLTNPAQRFVVRGQNGNSALEFDNKASNTEIVSYDRVASAYRDLYLHTSSASPTMVLNTSGNVGIGTTAPRGNFDVSASGNVNQWLGSYFTGTVAEPSLNLFRSNNNTVGTLTATVTGQSLGRINFIGVESGGNTDDAAFIRVVQDGNVSSFRVPAYMDFGTGDATNNPTTRMRITSGGNVGIGTTNPNNRLHVSSNVNTTGYAPPAFGNGQLRLNPSNQGPGDMILEIGANNSPSGLYWIQTFNVGSPTAAAGNLILQPSAGNVGIGTTSPTQRLHVVGTTNLFGNGGASAFWGNTSDLGRLTYIGSIPAILSSTNVGLIFGGGTTEQMRLDASGNLGLGVTPSAWGATWRALELEYSSAGTAIASLYPAIMANTYNTGGGFFYKVTGQASYYQQIIGQHRWHTAPSGTAGNAITFSQVMTLDASGNLGLGVTNPSSYNAGGNHLVIGGGAFRGLTIAGTTEGNIYFADGTTGTETYRGSVGYNHTSDYLFFYSAANERMRITSTGNVLIGSTTDGGQKLQVTGGVVRFQNAGTFELDLYNSTANNFLRLSATATGGLIGTIQNIPLVFISNASERMRLTGAGELLINTTTDAGDYKLQVNGNVYSSSEIHSMGGTTGAQIKLSGSTNYGIIKDVNSVNRIWFENTGSYRTILDLPASGTKFDFRDSAGTSLLQVFSGGSIQTAAPSGGTAKPFKIGAAAVVTPTSPNRTIEIEIDGTTYYLTAKTTND